MFSAEAPIIVIGAGGAGILAARRAAERGCPVLVLERNRKPGIKLLVSGGGKCNITHVGTVDDVQTGFPTREARFLKPALHRFGNRDIIRILEHEGVATFARPDGRIFPASGRAADVVEALTLPLRRMSVTIQLNTHVEDITAQGDQITGVVASGRHLPSRHVILATGGVSYPKTGTTGDGYAWAQKLGHTVVPLRPALAPISLEPTVPPAWRGVALRGGRLSVFTLGRTITRWDGDILFTHEGISGPAALEVSRAAAVAMEHAEVRLLFDAVPARGFAALDADLEAAIRGHPHRLVGSVLEGIFPRRLLAALLGHAGLDPARRCGNLTRNERRALAHVLKSWDLGRITSIDIERGEVTAGGVHLSEVDPHTMNSRKVRGLYLCGEVLDVAGRVGGYNLQAAFSTGFVAGDAAADAWLAAPGGH